MSQHGPTNSTDDASNRTSREPDESNIKVYDRPESSGISLNVILTAIGIIALLLLVVLVVMFVL